MHRSILRPALYIAGLSVLALNFSPAAQALPGQSVPTVTQWVKQHPLLAPFKRGIGELSGLPFYNAQATVKTGTVNFAMNADRADKQSRQETIAYSTGTAFGGFTRENKAGLDLIKSIYDNGIVSDFQKSRYVARVDFNPYEHQFYRGQRFGYVVLRFKEATEGKRFFHFTVVPLSDLNGRIVGTQQCRKQSAFGCE